MIGISTSSKAVILCGNTRLIIEGRPEGEGLRAMGERSSMVDEQKEAVQGRNLNVETSRRIQAPACVAEP